MTNGEVDRLGERIKNSGNHIDPKDMEALQVFRRSFQIPIANVFEYVYKAAKSVDKNSIVTYRIKRIDTIIRKLQRFSGNENGRMNLSRMWDIAGCRCILKSLDPSKVYRLLSLIQQEYGENCKINDYIKEPKRSGYRSLHIYVKDKVNNKSVEIQIRNIEHHYWATLVEIIDVLYGEKNKETQNRSSMGEFLSLYAIKDSLGDAEQKRLMRLENRYQVFETMSQRLTSNYLKVMMQWIKQRSNGSYYVITANKTWTQLESFKGFDQAESAYYSNYVNHPDSNVVLSHIPNASFDEINIAYSNYVLTMHSFFADYRAIISQRIMDDIRLKRRFRLIVDFKLYRRNVVNHIKNLFAEAQTIAVQTPSREINVSQLNKCRKNSVSRTKSWYDESMAFVKRIRKEPSLDLFTWFIVVNQFANINLSLNKIRKQIQPPKSS